MTQCRCCIIIVVIITAATTTMTTAKFSLNFTHTYVIVTSSSCPPQSSLDTWVSDCLETWWKARGTPSKVPSVKEKSERVQGRPVISEPGWNFLSNGFTVIERPWVWDTCLKLNPAGTSRDATPRVHLKRAPKKLFPTTLQYAIVLGVRAGYFRLMVVV